MDDLLKLLDAVSNLEIDYMCHQSNKEAEEVRKYASDSYTLMLEYLIRVIYSELKIHDIYQKEKN